MKAITLGNLRTKFFAYVQTTGRDVVRLGDLQKRLGISATQENNLLKRLVKSGIIIRLKRGVYLAPLKFPSSGHWQPNEYYVIQKYMEVIDADYYVGGFAALHHHHLTTQIPNQFTIYNNKLSAKNRVGQLKIQFIKITSERLGGITALTLPDLNIEVNMANLARTLMDSVNDWSRYNTLPVAYEWIARCRNDKLVIAELIDVTSKFANKSTVRRIGYVLEELGASEKQLKPLLGRLKLFHDWVKLNPKGVFKGATNKRWGIINNVNNVS